ncbi:MAG TPA: DUF2723 domain-containing protein, partial [Balneolaceae bacterium]|nr:DUF2723 domain-containing protein [Balneolaceae bacterium]
MFSNHRTTNRTLALFVFAAAFILYLCTMAPTASFWDPSEYIPAAHWLEVNHPPGSPLFLLVGRVFSMFMPKNWVAASINFISVLASSATIMLLYLVIVRVVREFKGYEVAKYAYIDRIGMYGGALIGALGFAVTGSFWFNAVEAEVYASSMLFTSMVVWLSLKWAEEHEQPHSDRMLILIAYMVGLALGVHLLSLLALFYTGAIIYIKKKEFSFLSACAAAALTIIAFLSIYPFTLNILPKILKHMNHGTYGLIGPIDFIVIVVGLMAIAIYITHRNGYYWANLVLVGYTMILIGYSSYLLVPIRARTNPPINENNPQTIQRFINYVGRKQYGSKPLIYGRDYSNKTGRISKKAWFPRRYSAQPSHLKYYAQYSSDWSYFWHYQVVHMYIRYFNWNFIGRDSDIYGAGWQGGLQKSHHKNNPAHDSYYYLPFLLGLFGMLYHFQRDWKQAGAVMVLFIMTGIAIIVFLNQVPHQPRERFYAYVGSFFAFSIWMGIGAAGLVDLVKEYLRSSKWAAYGVLGLAFLGVPFLLGFQNFNNHDRHNRYIAPDYAYNLLQSVGYEGILFTNGDNDTFPLWYEQEVMGVRRDVRVVNLSLLNTKWYIKELRDNWSHNSAPLPISFTNKQINNLAPKRHQPDTVNIPVNRKMLSNAYANAKNYRKALGVKPDVKKKMFNKSIRFGMPVDSLNSSVSWYFKGRYYGKDRQGNKIYYTQVQDQVIMNILKNNHWLRPVYFADTIPKSSKLALQPYLRYEGQASRVVPKRHSGINRLGWVDTGIMSHTLSKFRFHKWTHPHNYLNSYIRRMFGTYRISLQKLSDAYLNKDQPDSADTWLKWGRKNIPFYPKISTDGSMVRYAYSFAQAGDNKNAVDMANECEERVFSNLKWYFNKYLKLRQKVVNLKNKSKKSQGYSESGKQRRLQSKMQNLSSQSQNLGDKLYGALDNLMIIQRIYYMAGQDNKAKAVANRVNNITGKR